MEQALVAIFIGIECEPAWGLYPLDWVLVGHLLEHKPQISTVD
jgi:hypothetical protein